MSKSREDLLKEYYGKFRFVEEDINKFQEIIFSDANDNNIKEEDVRNNIINYIVNVIKDGGLVNLFNKSVKCNGLERTFMFFNKIMYKNDINVKRRDVRKILNNSSYKKYIISLKDNYSFEIDSKTYPFTLNSLLTQMIDYINVYQKTSLTNTQENDYLAYISRFPVLTAEEERELFTRYKNGDKEAFEEIFNSNLRLVNQIAHAKYNRASNISFMDYVQEGNIGLMKAIGMFDLSKETRFSTYATSWILNRLDRASKTHGNLVWIPVYRAEQIITVKKFVNDYINEYNRKPTEEEIIKGLNISKKTYEDIIAAMKVNDYKSIDAPVGHDAKRESDETKIEEILLYQNEVTEEESILNKIVNDSLRKQEEDAFKNLLTERETEIVKKRFGLDDGREKTLGEIGNGLQLSRERIRQIEKKALIKLRQFGKEYIKDIDDEEINQSINSENIDGTTAIERKRLSITLKKGRNIVGRQRIDICTKLGIKKEIYDVLLANMTRQEQKLIDKRNSGKELSKRESKDFQILLRKMKVTIERSKESGSDIVANVNADTNIKTKSRKRVDMCTKLGVTHDVYQVMLACMTKQEQKLINKRNSGEKLSITENMNFQYLVRKMKLMLERINKLSNDSKQDVNQKESSKKITEKGTKLEKTNTTNNAENKVNSKTVQNAVIIPDFIPYKKGEDNVESERVITIKPKEETPKASKKQTENQNVVVIKAENKIVEGLENQYENLISMVISDPVISKEIPLFKRAIFCSKYGLCGFNKLSQSISVALTYGIKEEEVNKIIEEVLCTLKEYLANIVTRYEESLYQKFEEQSQAVRNRAFETKEGEK